MRGFEPRYSEDPVGWQERYLSRYYDRARGFRDGTTQFHDLCAASLARGGRILEVGAGVANATTRFLATLGELHGVDPDPEVRTNPDLASAHVLDGDRFPFEDASFDGAVSNFVIEHVDEPERHLAEIRRVLRPGGTYVFRTPNRFHYVAVGSALTPHWVHVRLANRLRNLPPEAHDPYPTRYRMNSRRAVRRTAERCGLVVDSLHVIEPDPSYGQASRALFLTFMAYERVVNSTRLLEDLRSNILGVLRRA